MQLLSLNINNTKGNGANGELNTKKIGIIIKWVRNNMQKTH